MTTFKKVGLAASAGLGLVSAVAIARSSGSLFWGFVGGLGILTTGAVVTQLIQSIRIQNRCTRPTPGID